MEFLLNETADVIYHGTSEEEADAFVVIKKNMVGGKTITKVFVDPKYRGQGVAGKLMAAAVSYAEKNNIFLDATCSYAQSWFEKNPQAQHVLKK